MRSFRQYKGNPTGHTICMHIVRASSQGEPFFAFREDTPVFRIPVHNFLFDTGATDHMVGDPVMLDSVAPVGKDLRVLGFGDGTVGYPTHKGPMSILF